MSKRRNQINNKQSDQQMANILYQRLGQSVYAFAEVDGEVYVSKVDEEQSRDAQMESLAPNFFFDDIAGESDADGNDPSPTAS